MPGHGAPRWFHRPAWGGCLLLALVFAGGCHRSSDGPRLIQAIQRHATGKSDLTPLTNLLDDGANPNARTEDEGTPLMIATFMADVDAVNLLLDRGANPNAKNREGVTPLMTALTLGALGRAIGRQERPEVVERQIAVVKALIRKGADVNARTPKGMTALKLAKASSNAVLIDTLLKAGAKE